MMKLRDLITIVCFFRHVIGLLPERTPNSPYSNGTATQIVGNNSALEGRFCCYVYPAQVGLNKWYRNSTVEHVNETIITKYLQYNNTVIPTATITVPNTTTVFLNAANTPLNLPGIPNDLAASGSGPDRYIRSVLLTDTEYKDGFTVIPSPTPFIKYHYMHVFPGRRDNAGICMGSTGNTVYPATTVTNIFRDMSSTITQAAQTMTRSTYTYDVTSVAEGWFDFAGRYNGGDLAVHGPGPGSDYPLNSVITLSSPHYAVVSQTDSWVGVQVMVDMKQIADELRGNPEVLAQYPDITLCEIESGAGAPTVHIQASILTLSSAVTSTTNAIFTRVATSSIASPASNSPSVVSTTESRLESLRSNALESSPSVQTDADSQSKLTKPSADSTATSGSDVVSTKPESQESSSLKTPLTLDPTNTADTLRPTLSTSRTSETPKSVQGVALQTDLSGTPQTAAVQTSVPPSAKTNSAQPQSEPSASTLPGQSIESRTTYSDNTDTTTGDQIPSYTLIPGKSSSFFVSFQSGSAGNLAITVPDDTEALRHETSKDTRTSNSHLVAADSAAAISSASVTYITSSETGSDNSAAVLATSTVNSVSISDDNSRSNEQLTSVSSILESRYTLGATDSVIATPTSSGTYVVFGQTLVPGGSAIQISGNTYSLPTSGMGIAVDGQITTFYATVSGSPILSLGSQEITFNAITVESTLKETARDSGGQVHLVTSTSNATTSVSLSTISLPSASASSASLSNATTSQTQTASTIASTSSRSVSAKSKANFGMMFILGLILVL